MIFFPQKIVPNPAHRHARDGLFFQLAKNPFAGSTDCGHSLNGRRLSHSAPLFPSSGNAGSSPFFRTGCEPQYQNPIWPSVVAQKKLWLVVIFDAAAANSARSRAKFMSSTASTVPASLIQ